MEQPQDFAPTEPEFPDTCPFCGGFEDDAPEPMSVGERVFLVTGYIASTLLVCIGLLHVVGWLLA
jgi:hypothetical protein